MRVNGEFVPKLFKTKLKCYSYVCICYFKNANKILYVTY